MALNCINFVLLLRSACELKELIQLQKKKILNLVTNLLPINPSCWHLLLPSFNALLMKFFYSCSIISPGIGVRVTGG